MQRFLQHFKGFGCRNPFVADHRCAMGSLGHHVQESWTIEPEFGDRPGDRDNRMLARVVARLRSFDWIDRHHDMAYILDVDPDVGRRIEKLMAPDELLTGRSTGRAARDPDKRVFVVKDKGMTKRQTRITDFVIRNR